MIRFFEACTIRKTTRQDFPMVPVSKKSGHYCSRYLKVNLAAKTHYSPHWCARNFACHFAVSVRPATGASGRNKPLIAVDHMLKCSQKKIQLNRVLKGKVENKQDLVSIPRVPKSGRVDLSAEWQALDKLNVNIRSIALIARCL